MCSGLLAALVPLQRSRLRRSPAVCAIVRRRRRRINDRWQVSGQSGCITRAPCVAAAAAAAAAAVASCYDS